MNDEAAITQPIHAHALEEIRARATGTTNRKHPLTRPILICAALTALADWFFFRQVLGWAIGAYLLILLITFAWSHKTLRSAPGRVTAAALLGLSFCLMSQPGPLSLLLATLGIILFAMLGRLVWRANTLLFAQRFLYFLFTGWLALFRDQKLYRRWRRACHGGRSPSLMGINISRWMIPVLFTSIFVWLFAIANPLIEFGLTKTTVALQHFFSRFDLNPARIMFWSFCILWLWALLRMRRKSVKTTQAAQPVRQITDPFAIVRCLALFNIVFAAHSILDVLYLFGGAALPAGMTYATYAHRGAYPLIATALLAAAFVLVTFRDGLKTIEMETARRWVYLWLAQNVFLTFSALWRLKLYIEVYSLTRWRIAAAIWMILVGAGLMWITARIVFARTNRWLINATFLTAAFVLYSCCFINFDNFMAWYNVTHCREVNHTSAPLDLRYLTSLGPESLPAMEWLAKQPVSQNVAIAAERSSGQLRQQLNNELQNWRGWTYRRHQLKRYL